MTSQSACNFACLDYAYRLVAEKRPTHFISLFERDGVKKTVYSFYHNQADRYYPVRIASTAPYWAEICHSGNLANSLKDDDIAGFITHHALIDQLSGPSAHKWVHRFLP